MSMSEPFLPVSESDDRPEVPDDYESEIDLERELDVDSEEEDDEEYDYSSRENFFRPPTAGDSLDEDELEDDLDEDEPEDDLDEE
jgi:ribonuclease E